MNLALIIIFSLSGMLISSIRSGNIRTFLLFVLSLTALYSLQPALTLRAFDYWLPTTAIGLAVWVWFATRNIDLSMDRKNVQTLSQLIGLVTVIAVSSYLPQEVRWFTSLPLAWTDVLIFILALTAVAWGILVWRKRSRKVDGLLVVFIIALFVGLKTPSLSIKLARVARQISGQSLDLASALDLNWLGFSYIAFRLLHVLRDYRSRRLPELNLREFMLYVFFFPALSAGPIDRVERFIKDLSADRESTLWDQWHSGATRVVMGLFKKFIVADSLALIALRYTHVDLVESRGWLWLLLYAYSFRIYFDFGGYTDIAIGIGMLSGIQLPENFQRPYLQTDLGAFWNRWHITLAQWFRAYIFNPLTRMLRQGILKHYSWMIILIAQLVTMVLIGLWHGVTWNFVAWGAWHALGLFIHNRWIDIQRRTNLAEWGGSVASIGRAVAGAFLTFNFVSLGWVWFSTPNMQVAWSTFLKLLGGRLG